jgi:hypothetical protein
MFFEFDTHVSRGKKILQRCVVKLLRLVLGRWLLCDRLIVLYSFSFLSVFLFFFVKKNEEQRRREFKSVAIVYGDSCQRPNLIKCGFSDDSGRCFNVTKQII